MAKLFFSVQLLILTPHLALAQPSRCADCHFANPDSPRRNHLMEWDLSPHSRNAMGCESCHQGDAATFEEYRAHRNILNSRNPASPVHRNNLPNTCGKCHGGQLSAFKRSRHWELLRQGRKEGPTCTTCHGQVAAFLFSPRALERQCVKCHGQDGVSPHPEFARQGRRLLEGVRDVRTSLKQALRLIGRIKDETRKSDLQGRLRQAEVPLLEAVESGHSFRFEALEERLAVAHDRAESLLETLANPR